MAQPHLTPAGRPLAEERTALLEALAAAGEIGIELISALRPGTLAPPGRSAGDSPCFCGPLDGAGALSLLATRCAHRQLRIQRCSLLPLQLRPPLAQSQAIVHLLHVAIVLVLSQGARRS